MLIQFDPERGAKLAESAGPLEGRIALHGEPLIDERGVQFGGIDRTTGLRVVLRVLSARTPDEAALGVEALTRVARGGPKLAETLVCGCAEELVYTAYRQSAGVRLDKAIRDRRGLPLETFVSLAVQSLVPLAAPHSGGLAVGGLRACDIALRPTSGHPAQVTIEDFGIGRVVSVLEGVEPLLLDDIRSLGELFSFALTGRADLDREAWSSGCAVPRDQAVPEGLHRLVADMLEPLEGEAPADSIEVAERLIDGLPDAWFEGCAVDLARAVRRTGSRMVSVPRAIEALHHSPLSWPSGAYPAVPPTPVAVPRRSRAWLPFVAAGVLAVGAGAWALSGPGRWRMGEEAIVDPRAAGAVVSHVDSTVVGPRGARTEDRDDAIVVLEDDADDVLAPVLDEATEGLEATEHVPAAGEPPHDDDLDEDREVELDLEHEDELDGVGEEPAMSAGSDPIAEATAPVSGPMDGSAVSPAPRKHKPSPAKVSVRRPEVATPIERRVTSAPTELPVLRSVNTDGPASRRGILLRGHTTVPDPEVGKPDPPEGGDIDAGASGPK